jgi:hypothetical protein
MTALRRAPARWLGAPWQIAASRKESAAENGCGAEGDNRLFPIT